MSDVKPVFTTCYVCEGRIGGRFVVLSAKKSGVARCESCAPGTAAWAKKYPDSLMGQWWNQMVKSPYQGTEEQA